MALEPGSVVFGGTTCPTVLPSEVVIPDAVAGEAGAAGWRRSAVAGGVPLLWLAADSDCRNPTTQPCFQLPPPFWMPRCGGRRQPKSTHWPGRPVVRHNPCHCSSSNKAGSLSGQAGACMAVAGASRVGTQQLMQAPGSLKCSNSFKFEFYFHWGQKKCSAGTCTVAARAAAAQKGRKPLWGTRLQGQSACSSRAPPQLAFKGGSSPGPLS